MLSPGAAHAFFDAAPEPAQLEALTALWAGAQQTWPLVTAREEAFFAALGVRLKHRLEALAPLRLADLWLAFACLARDAVALRHFDGAVLARAKAVIAGLGDADFQDEVVQHTRARLLMAEQGEPARLATYTGQGALLSWVRSVLYRAAISLKRTQGHGGDAEALAALPDPAVLADLHFIGQVHRREFAVAFEEGLARLDDTLRAVLRLSLVEQLSIDQISIIYAVHRATAARWVVRAREELARDVEQRLRERLALSPVELGSLMESLQQNLGVSLARMIEEA